MTLVAANSFMTLFASLFLICASAHAPDNSDYVQVRLVNGTSVLKANNSRVFKANASGTSAIYGQTPQTACEVTLYDHYYEGAKAEYTGDKKALHGTGDFPLGAFKSTSAVKVTGKYCVAYGFTTPDCTGDKGSGIKADTQYEGDGANGNELGVVGPSTELEKHWGCNDCLNCVRVERSATCECTGGTAATGNDCQTDGAQTCTACNAGYFMAGTTCQLCTTCPANAAIKTACDGTADAVCQCARGFAGASATACAGCTGKTFADEAGLSACKACADGASGKAADGATGANDACENTKCQRPSPPESAEIDTDNCPENAAQDATCKLKCKEGYTESANVAYTCTAVTGSANAEFTGGSIVCTKITPAPTLAPTPAPTKVWGLCTDLGQGLLGDGSQHKELTPLESASWEMPYKAVKCAELASQDTACMVAWCGKPYIMVSDTSHLCWCQTKGSMSCGSFSPVEIDGLRGYSCTYGHWSCTNLGQGQFGDGSQHKELTPLESKDNSRANAANSWAITYKAGKCAMLAAADTACMVCGQPYIMVYDLDTRCWCQTSGSCGSQTRGSALQMYSCTRDT